MQKRLSVVAEVSALKYMVEWVAVLCSLFASEPCIDALTAITTNEIEDLIEKGFPVIDHEATFCDLTVQSCGMERIWRAFAPRRCHPSNI